jgi:hypothetical protein
VSPNRSSRFCAVPLRGAKRRAAKPKVGSTASLPEGRAAVSPSRGSAPRRPSPKGGLPFRRSGRVGGGALCSEKQIDAPPSRWAGEATFHARRSGATHPRTVWAGGVGSTPKGDPNGDRRRWTLQREGDPTRTAPSPQTASAALARRNARRTIPSLVNQRGFRSAEAARNRPRRAPGSRPPSTMTPKRNRTVGRAELVTESFAHGGARSPKGPLLTGRESRLELRRRPPGQCGRNRVPGKVGRSPELFFPFSVRNRGEPPIGGVASPTSLPPQVFSTSRGFAPSATVRVCFAPVTLMGFVPFRGFPPLDAEHLSARRAPLDVCSEECAFRGLSNQRIRAHLWRPVKASRWPILSWASSSPGCSPRPRRHTL